MVLLTTFKEAYETNGNVKKPVFPKNVGTLIKTLGLTEQEYIDNHSVLPYYRMFVSYEQFITICENMFSSKVDNYHQLFYQNQPVTSSYQDQKIYYCPECLKENMSYSALKRHHQIVDVNVCHKHHCKLNYVDFNDIVTLLDIENWDMTVRSCVPGCFEEQISEDIEFIIENALRLDLDIIREMLSYEEEFFRKGQGSKYNLNPDWMDYYDSLPYQYQKYKDKASFKRYTGNYENIKAIERVEYIIFVRAIAGSFENFVKHFSSKKAA